jgi:hypothetical protein
MASNNLPPVEVDWSDPTMVECQIANIEEMTNIWSQHQKDIDGWLDLATRAVLDNNQRMARQYTIRAEHSAWVRTVLVARAKYKNFNYDPFPSVIISSFAFPENEPEEYTSIRVQD